MTRNFVLAILVLTTARAAHADTYELVPPAGWDTDVEGGHRVARMVSAERHFAAVPFQASVTAWAAPDGGASLFVTTLFADHASELPTGARAELTSMTANARGRQQPSESGWRIEDGVGFADAAWSDDATGVEHLVRGVVYAVVADDGPRLRSIRAECVLGPEASESAHAHCLAALDTFRLTVPADGRVGIGPVTPPTAADPGPAEVASARPPPLELRTAEIGPAAPGRPSPVLYEGAAHDRDRGPSPWLLVGGGALVAVGLWLSARARASRERAAGPSSAPTEDDPA